MVATYLPGFSLCEVESCHCMKRRKKSIGVQDGVSEVGR